MTASISTLRPEFYIKHVTWSTHEQALRSIREQVFVVEQHVPEALEWDGDDATAAHLLAYDQQQQAIACARLIETGSIGRMAVVKAWRGKGVGQALLTEAITYFQQRGCQKITLSAQQHAISFYEQVGFIVCSDLYLDANILHVDMQLNI